MRADRSAGDVRRLARLLLPHLWPADDPGFRLRVLAALAFLAAAKSVNVSVPFFLKGVIDALGTQPQLGLPPSLCAAQKPTPRTAADGVLARWFSRLFSLDGSRLSMFKAHISEAARQPDFVHQSNSAILA